MKSGDDWEGFKSLSLHIPFPNKELRKMTENYVDSHCHLDKIYKGYKLKSVFALTNCLSREQHRTRLQLLICFHISVVELQTSSWFVNFDFGYNGCAPFRLTWQS